MENSLKQTIQVAIDLLIEEVKRIKEEKQQNPKDESIQIGHTSEMLAHILSIQHLREVINKI